MTLIPLVILAFSFAFTAHGAPDKVKIDLYYEFLCGPCKDFTANQLEPTMKKVADIMDVTMIPYGNAKTVRNCDGSYNFTCQHGEEECLGNKLHACAIAKLNNTVADVEVIGFLRCTEAKHKDEYHAGQSPADYGKECANELKIPYEEVDKCYNSVEGDKLLAAMGDKTKEEDKRHGRKYVPWIVVNGSHSFILETWARFNLLSLVCNQYKGTKPKGCN